MNPRLGRGALFTTCAIVCMAIAAPVAAQERSFDVPAQSAAGGVAALARQANIQIFASRKDTGGKRTNAVRGEMTVEQALGVLLKGTGLTVRRTSDRTYTVVAVTEARAVTSQAASTLGEDAPAADEEIVVTGTNIRGAAPVGTNVTVVSREDIERSGRGRPQDILATLPQNYGGGASEYFGTDSGASNWNLGQTVDLRGLGVGSTLVLVNGRRQPASGTEGSFVDISSIPSAAVERIEILTDGASALYGSDAIGGVVNFVLRRDFNGAETSLRFATADGHANEIRASQLFGRSWRTGHALIGYQYYRREMFLAKDGVYSRLGTDFRSLGGRDNRLPGYSNPGAILNPTTNAVAFSIPRGQNGVGLTTADLIPGTTGYRDSVTGVSRLPEQELHSAFAFVAQEISDSIELFADGRYSHRRFRNPTESVFSTLRVPSTNPFYLNPFGGTAPVSIRYEFLDDLGNQQQRGTTETYSISAGAKAKLGSDWRADLVGTHAQESNSFAWYNQLNTNALNTALADPNPTTAFNPYGDGSVTNPATLARIGNTTLRDATAKLESVSLVANGPLLSFVGGRPKMALGIDLRRETLDAERGTLPADTGIFVRSTSSVGAMRRDVTAVFGELIVPVFGEPNAVSGFDSLLLSAAGRYENYSDFGETFNPRLGISWSPVPNLRVRGSWGTSFRAPRLNQLNENVNVPRSSLSANAIDPLSPTNRSNVLTLTGASDMLREETADVYGLGVDWQPASLGIKASVTYFRIDYQNKIGSPPSGSTILGQEAQWVEVITRNPTAQQVAGVCQRSDFVGTTCPPAGSIAAIVDGRLRNLGGLKVRGIDFELSKRFDGPFGSLTIGADGTYLFTYDQATSATSGYFDFLDEVRNPKDLRLRASANWEKDGLYARIVGNYVGASKDDANDKRVGSWTTIDFSLGAELTVGPFKGLGLSLSAVNLFDKAPPFVDDGFYGFDPSIGNDLGRVVSIEITKKW